MEELCAVERKDLPDLVHSFTAGRPGFINRLRLLSAYAHRLLVVTTTLSTVKSRYPFSSANPTRIMQSLVAVLAGLGVPFVCTETHELAEETIASYLYQFTSINWLEANDSGGFLADDDL